MRSPARNQSKIAMFFSFLLCHSDILTFVLFDILVVNCRALYCVLAKLLEQLVEVVSIIAISDAKICALTPNEVNLF